MFIENKDFLSWASGTKVGSHYLRLKQFLLAQDESVKLEIMNVAVPATTTYDLERQATRVLRKMRSGRYDALKYVTILVGANDVCSRDNPSGIPVEVMRSNLLKAIDVLAQVSQAEPVRVLVVGIPKIPDLAQPGIRDAKTTLGLSCHRVRDQMLALCNNLLSWRTPEEYRKQLSIVEETNRMLEQTVHEGNAKYPNVQMAYTGRLFEQVIPLEDLAIDCFHPNAKAHDKIAQDTWLDQPWFR
jgi:lysophospholipase L1-like esterase